MTTFPFSSTPARSARLIVVALALMLAVALVVALPGLIWADTFITTVDTGTNALGDAGAASAVALKSNGLAVISYWDKTAGNVGDLKIGFCNDPACSNPTIQTVDPQMFDARATSIAVTSGDVPVISYPGDSGLKLAICNSAIDCSSPTLRTLDPAGVPMGMFNSLVLNGSDVPIVSYSNGTNLQKVAICQDASCSGVTTRTVETISITNSSLSGTSVKLNSAGAPVISYGYAGTVGANIVSALRLATCESATDCTAPTINTVDNSAGILPGRDSSLALNSSGFPVISYHEEHFGDLKLAICSDALCASPAFLTTLDTAGNTGLFTSLQLNSSGFPVISYFDSTPNFDLKLATCNDATCSNPTLQTLDSAGSVGQFSSLALNSTDGPVISYYDATNKDLKLYTNTTGCDTNSWTANNEASLNSAIGCYNTKTTAGTYTITLTQDIDLTASTTIVANSTAGVNLVIEGDGFAVDGQDTVGVRPFEIAADTTVTMNQLTVTGGNIPSDQGGGIYNGGTLTISSSTISDNSALTAGGIENRGTLTVFNSTISGNSTSGSPGGGGIVNGFGGVLTLDSVTISANSDTSATGTGGLWTSNTAATLRNSILAGNSGRDCGSSSGTPVTDGGHNLVFTQSNCGLTNGANGTIVGVPAQLGPLADNGGPTFTHALLAGSPAINAGDTSLTTDQRGVARPQDGADDIGAYESLCGTATGWTAATELELDTAIGCFNKQTVAQSYVITVTGDFTVTGGPPAIDNPNSGPSLVIEGGNHTIDGDGRQGFGIQSATDVTMNNLTLTDWRNLLGGGAIRHDNVGSNLMLNNMTLTYNTSGFGAGALFSRGVVTITNSTFFSNTNNSVNGGGAIEINGPGKLTLIDSELTDNAAAGNGGAILAESNPTIIIEGSFIDGNMAADSGGGIYQLDGTTTISDSTVSNNTAVVDGGGILNSGGNLTLNNATVAENTADTGGGGIYNGATLTINQSTVSDNTVTDAAASGGGIANVGTLTMQNSTVSGNTAVNGGGISNVDGTVSLDSVTIAANTASSSGAGLFTVLQPVALKNSILAANTGASDCETGALGSITDNGNNLVGTQNGCGFTNGVNGNIVGVDPLLGPLADNGGETETHALLGGSPAIDAGSTTLPTDQRGVTRPVGAADDIGAYESLCGTATSWTAGTEFELDTAIGCFNKQTVAGSYTISVTANISLTTSIASINNPTSGPSLVIVGGDHTIDGGDAPGNPGKGGFVIDSPTAVSITDLTVTRCRLLLTGGAIRNLNGGALTLNNVTLTHNQAGFGGGALSSNGPVTISNSVISHNYNPAGAGGGGILIESPGSLTLKNSTVSGNTSDVTGGGISVEGGSASLDSVTVADNSAPTGGGIAQTGGTVTLVNTIVGNNSASGSGPDLSGTITSNDYNLIEDVAGATFAPQAHDITGVDPLLDTLQDNGGPTETHALLAGSPALDAGDTLETTDQRGEARPFGLADDIGAFELQTCYVDSWSVGNEAELNAAIACYNTKTVAGSYTITLTQDILLSDRLTDRSTTAIDNDTAGVELVIEGSGFAVDGQGNFDVRPFTVQANTTVTMNDLTATGGNVLGGGVDNRGGGILNQGNLTLNRSTVISNTAETRGGGLATRGGTVAINDSTIANNVSGTPSSPGFGGGLHNENGQVTIRNSTISGNESVGGLSNNPSYGGGIASNDNITLDSVTVADNYAFTGDGLYFINNTTSQVTVSVKNTILATNGFDDCHFETIAGGATFNDQGHNLILQDSTSKPCGIVNGVNNNIVADPQLLPLADNGGALTHAFRLDSPAIDAGDTSLPTDQRGVARPQDLADDIGALESTACGNDSWGVSRMTELNAAVECFNAKTTPDIYTISILDGGWPASLSTTAIDNSTPGVSLVIEGNGSTIDWNGDLFPGTRPFLIETDTTVTINDLFISNGNVLGTERGGAIRNLGNLTINRSTIAGSRAEYDGGGISNHGVMVINDSTVFANTIEGGSEPVSGGGIYNEGSLTISNSTISGNTSSNDGGGIGNIGTLDLDSVTVTANSAQGAVGGGVGAGVFTGASGTLTTRNSILAGNLDAEDCWAASPVTDGGHNLVETQINCGFVNGVNGNIVGQAAVLGPLHNNGGPTRTHLPNVGSPAINAGDTPLATDQRGIARPQGPADDIGAVEVEASCPAFPVSVANEGELNFAIGCYNAETVAGTYTISVTQNISLTASTTAIDNATSGVELLVEGGSHTVDAQGVLDAWAFFVQADTTVTIREITVTGGNTTGPSNSGAVISVLRGMLTLIDSTLTGNQGSFGGALSNATGTVTIENSTLSNNNASGGFLPLGGAIFNAGSDVGGTTIVGTVHVINSTISGNQTAGRGGGIYNSPDGVLNVTNSTISDNQATMGGGGIVNSTDSTITLNNAIVANSTGGDCVLDAGTINAENSLIEDGLACVNGTNSNNLTGDPNLGVLQNNGGPTETHALLPGSIAIDAGANALAVDPGGNPLPTDQRGAGFPRVLGGTVDMGAFERDISPSIVMSKTVGTDPAACATTDNITVAAGTDVYYCYTVTNTGDVTLPLHDLVDDELGTLLDDFAFNLAPGATVSTVDAGAVISITATSSVTNTAVWTAFVDPSVTASFTDTAMVNVVNPSITMTKTVGTDPAACATTDNITVAEGTDVYYCYTVTNTGDVALPLHDLVDDQLGTLLDDFAFNLAPGATVSTVDAGAVISITATSSVTNTAVWTAFVDPSVTASFTDTATVMVMPPTAVTLVGLEAIADRAAPMWPWLLAVMAAALAVGGALQLRRNDA